MASGNDLTLGVNYSHFQPFLFRNKTEEFRKFMKYANNTNWSFFMMKSLFPTSTFIFLFRMFFSAAFQKWNDDMGSRKENQLLIKILLREISMTKQSLKILHFCLQFVCENFLKTSKCVHMYTWTCVHVYSLSMYFLTILIIIGKHLSFLFMDNIREGFLKNRKIAPKLR